MRLCPLLGKNCSKQCINYIKVRQLVDVKYYPEEDWDKGFCTFFSEVVE